MEQNSFRHTQQGAGERVPAAMHKLGHFAPWCQAINEERRTKRDKIISANAIGVSDVYPAFFWSLGNCGTGSSCSWRVDPVKCFRTSSWSVFHRL